MQFHIGFQIVDAGIGQNILYHVQRLQLTYVHGIDILWIAYGIAVSCPVDAFEILQQLLPRHDVDGEHRIASGHLVQGLYTYLMFNGPLGLHHALCVGIVVAYHLEVVLVQTLNGFYGLLLCLVRLGIILLSQRSATMTRAHHIL